MAKNSGKLILVTGATGKQGGAVLRHLREKGYPIRALTRDPEKPEARLLVGHGVEVFRGDLQDPDSVTRALDGAYGVYSVQNSLEGPESEMRQGFHLVEGARRAAVSHFVYSSVAGADQNTGIPHFESKRQIEERLRNSGLPFTIFRPVFFMENFLGMRQQIDAGSFSLPLSPETHLQMVAVDDIAAFVTLAFEHPGKWRGRAVDLAGDDLSMLQAAQVLSRVASHEVQYRQASWDEFAKLIPARRLQMFHWLEEVGYHVDIPTLRSDYPRLSGLEPWLRAHWQRVSGASS